MGAQGSSTRWRRWCRVGMRQPTGRRSHKGGEGPSRLRVGGAPSVVVPTLREVGWEGALGRQWKDAGGADRRDSRSQEGRRAGGGAPAREPGAVRTDRLRMRNAAREGLVEGPGTDAGMRLGLRSAQR